jgi:hypothetical protein
MRWEGGRALRPERPIEWEGLAMERIEGRMDDLDMWSSEGSEGTGSGWVLFEK